MKAIDFLDWYLDNGIDAGASRVIAVDDDFDFEAYFGYLPAKAVPSGKYVYLYGDMVFDKDMQHLWGCMGHEPIAINTDEDDHLNGGKCVIYLIKLED